MSEPADGDHSGCVGRTEMSRLMTGLLVKIVAALLALLVSAGGFAYSVVDRRVETVSEATAAVEDRLAEDLRSVFGNIDRRLDRLDNRLQRIEGMLMHRSEP